MSDEQDLAHREFTVEDINEPGGRGLAWAAGKIHGNKSALAALAAAGSARPAAAAPVSTETGDADPLRAAFAASATRAGKTDTDLNNVLAALDRAKLVNDDGTINRDSVDAAAAAMWGVSPAPRGPLLPGFSGATRGPEPYRSFVEEQLAKRGITITGQQ